MRRRCIAVGALAASFAAGSARAADGGSSEPRFQASVEGGIALGSLGDLNQLGGGTKPSSVGPHLRAGFEHPLASLGALRLRGEIFASWMQYTGGQIASPRNPIFVVSEGTSLFDVGWMLRGELAVSDALSIAPGVGVGLGGWGYATHLVSDPATGASGTVPAFTLHADVPVRLVLAERHVLFVSPGVVLMLPMADGGASDAQNGNIGVYDIALTPREAFGVGGGKWSGVVDIGYGLRF